jgi:hypothetical protein
MHLKPAGRLALAIVVGALGAGAAFAADTTDGGYGPAYGRGPVDPCREPVRSVKAHYEEQICYAGAHGYAACRWVSRVYVARIPRDCGRSRTVEDAWPIPQRSPAHAERGLSTKG